MHTLPAARLVGHDFLGNHIGELLFRQPASKPPATVTGSSGGSTVCPSDSKTVRRESIVSQHSTLVAPSSGTHADRQDAPSSLDSLFGIGAKGPSACPTDRVASPIHSSEGSGSEPGSVESRSGSADSDLNLHLSQLPLSHKKMTAESGPTSPRISFVTSFGAKNRSSGSRRGTSEASSASYFGVSSPHSSASMSPMEQPGSINWNIPFREQHQSFANAIEHNAWLDRKPSQQSQSSESSSQPLQPLTSRRDQSAKSAKPIASTGAATINAKSQSFSEASQPVRQRFNRAATESTLEPILQRQQPLGSPDEVPTPSAVGLAPSKSMGATTSGLLGHRRKPSLVPKEGDERTFCFVDNGFSEVESNGSLAEDALPSSTPLASVPERCASQSSLKSSPRSSYKEVVDVQYSAHQRATSAGDSLSRCASTLSNQSESISDTATTETAPDHAKSVVPGAPSARTTMGNKSSAQGPAPLPKSSLPAAQDSSSRPKRRLRIQPNVQSRQSLLERTMEQQRQASDAAIAANANGLPTVEMKRPAPTARVSESKLMSTSNGIGDIKERYDPIAHDAEKRVFRIQTATPPADASAFPFIMSGEDRSKTKLPASHARTSDWAREQSLLTGPSPSLGQAAADLGSSCTSSLTPDASTMASAAGPQSLSRHHTASHSSTSSGSGSSMDAPDLLSPAETELSTPELESPPEEATLHSSDGLSKPLPQRRTSPLSA